MRLERDKAGLTGEAGEELGQGKPRGMNPERERGRGEERAGGKEHEGKDRAAGLGSTEIQYGELKNGKSPFQ